jgi:UDP-glucose-4-epimerase GalE
MAGVKSKILVTGGAGYIGSHCCKILAANGYQPVVYDNLSTGHRDFVKWGPLIEGDVRNRENLQRVVALERPAAVMHFAALALVGESVDAPDRYWDVNVGGTLALLEAMRASGCDKLVFSSTCAVYGEPETIPIDEETAKAPVSPYGHSKLTAESMMESYDGAYGLRSVRLRYFNACGADPEGEIGEDHAPETHLIPLILDVALGRRENISIFGADYPTTDGTAIRDYVHVMDIAAAHLAATEHLLAGGGTTVVNLGTGEGASVAAVIAAVERVTGRKIATLSAPRRSGDPPQLIANPALAAELLGWSAISTLEAAVRDAWRWHQARFGADRPALMASDQ